MLEASFPLSLRESAGGKRGRVHCNNNNNNIWLDDDDACIYIYIYYN
jgi:hypothetical protein